MSLKKKVIFIAGYILVVFIIYWLLGKAYLEDVLSLPQRSGALIIFNSIERLGPFVAFIISFPMLLYFALRVRQGKNTLSRSKSISLFGRKVRYFSLKLVVPYLFLIFSIIILMAPLNHHVVRITSGVNGEKWELCKTYFRRGGRRKRKPYYVYYSNKKACEQLKYQLPGRDWTESLSSILVFLNKKHSE